MNEFDFGQNLFMYNQKQSQNAFKCMTKQIQFQICDELVQVGKNIHNRLIVTVYAGFLKEQEMVSIETLQEYCDNLEGWFGDNRFYLSRIFDEYLDFPLYDW